MSEATGLRAPSVFNSMSRSAAEVLAGVKTPSSVVARVCGKPEANSQMMLTNVLLAQSADERSAASALLGLQKEQVSFFSTYDDC